MATRASIAASALALAAGCTGNISSPGAAADAGAGAGLTPDVDGTAVTPEGDTPLACSQPHVAYAPFRRLAREQYDDAIRDLLGVEGTFSLVRA